MNLTCSNVGTFRGRTNRPWSLARTVMSPCPMTGYESNANIADIRHRTKHKDLVKVLYILSPNVKLIIRI
ncbi:MAG: hypothetical protein ACMUIU_04835 [bacterium]